MTLKCRKAKKTISFIHSGDLMTLYFVRETGRLGDRCGIWETLMQELPLNMFSNIKSQYVHISYGSLIRHITNKSNKSSFIKKTVLLDWISKYWQIFFWKANVRTWSEKTSATNASRFERISWAVIDEQVLIESLNGSHYQQLLKTAKHKPKHT